MANNFQNGPGGRLIKAQADNDSMPGIMLPEVEVTAPANSKNVDFGYMRPTISPLNQQQFMNVATGKDPGFQGQATMEQLREKMRGYKPEQIKASGRVGGYNPVNPIVFGQNPRSAAAMLGKVLTLGGEPMPGQGYSFSPTETLKGAAFDFVTGEGIGRGIKAAAPYVKPYIKSAYNAVANAPSIKVLLQSAEQRLKNPEAYNLLTGKSSGIRAKVYELIHKNRLRGVDKEFNRAQDEVRNLYAQGRTKEAAALADKNIVNYDKAINQAEDAYHNFRLNYSGLPLQPTGMGGGQGYIYSNKLNPKELVKVGSYFGDEQSMKNLIDAGKGYSPEGAKIAFPTDYVPLGAEKMSVEGNHRFAQFMPKIEGFKPNVTNGLTETERGQQIMNKLDELGVGIDYTGHGNIGSAGGDLGLVDLTYVGPPGRRVVPKNLQEYVFQLNKPVSERRIK